MDAPAPHTAHRNLWRPTEEGVWTGRHDGDGPEHLRWHQRIVSWPGGGPGVGGDPSGDVAVIGFASEEGVRRNHGRIGAAEAPDAIRRALAPTALAAMPSSCAADFVLHDAGTVTVVDGDLEAGHTALGERIAGLLDSHRLVVVLGGGHETAYGSYLGRRGSRRGADAVTAVVNLDAHFDLRDAPEATSGTPFLQMARDDAAAGREFRYLAVGVSPASNTRTLFDTARELGAGYVLDRDAQPWQLPQVLQIVDDAVAGVDLIHLSIDIDVLPASVAPGVSAPAAFGVPLEALVAVVEHLAESGRLAVLDIAEVCPARDVDGRTARTAARLVSAAVEAMPDRQDPISAM